MRVGTNGRSTWVAMGPLGWMTVGLFALLPWYATKYTLLGMWWLFFYGPYLLTRKAVDAHREAAETREQRQADNDHAFRHAAGPRDWSSHQ